MQLRNMVATVALLLASTVTQAAVLDFDDISTTPSYIEFNTYKGFNFVNALVIHKNYAVDSGYNRNTVSGNYSAWTYYDTLSMALASPGVFSFQGVNLAAAWDASQTLNIKGYNGNTQLYSLDQIITNTTTTRLNLNWTGITRLVFTKVNGGNQFVLDNLTYNASTTSVSAPATIGLFAVALSLFGFRRRKSAV